MLAILRRSGRSWATILVVYALLLANGAPLSAAASGPLGPLCSDVADPPSGQPDDGAAHADFCRILCAAASAPALPEPSATGLPPAPLAEVRPATIPRPAPPSRMPPGPSPQSPRAPPIAA